MEATFFKQASKVLCECRRVLMYAYVFGYYLTRNSSTINNNEIFCDNLNDLHFATESLSSLLEKDFGEGEDFKKELEEKLNDDEIKDLQANLTIGTKFKNKNDKKSEKNQQELLKDQPIKSLEEFQEVKASILDKQRYCNDRKNILISHVVEGYNKREWVFNIDDA